jgi:hypothetical protein
MKLLKKELALSLSILTPLFLSFTVMAFIPGYPILVGAFFVCFGIFHSFQSARESEDILYSALLPIAKRDVVTAKFTVTVFFQLAALCLFAVFTVLRMTVLSDVKPYVQNVMMNANIAFLGYVLLVFAAFNVIFLRGFFKTAYYFGKPFVSFIVAASLIIGIAETVHHFPTMKYLNDLTASSAAKQIPLLLISAAMYVICTYLSLKSSQKRFEMIDL